MKLNTGITIVIIIATMLVVPVAMELPTSTYTNIYPPGQISSVAHLQVIPDCSKMTCGDKCAREKCFGYNFIPGSPATIGQCELLPRGTEAADMVSGSGSYYERELMDS